MVALLAACMQANGKRGPLGCITGYEPFPRAARPRPNYHGARAAGLYASLNRRKTIRARSA